MVAFTTSLVAAAYGAANARKRPQCIAGALVFSSLSSGFGQTSPPPWAFEVASVKLSTPDSGRQNRIGRNELDIAYSPMRWYISYAYRVQTYQISGPSWIDDQGYEVVAKIPSSGDARKMPEMLQTLLSERFNLQVHEQMKDFPGFALEVGPEGPQFPTETDKGAARMQAAVGEVSSGRELIGVESPRLGAWRLRGINASVEHMARSLALQLRCPVVDRTNLKGPHNFVLEGSGSDGPDAASGGDDLETSIFYSVRQLGLRLKPLKVPLKMIVVDHADRVPIAN